MSNVVDKNQIRLLIEKKKEQIKRFDADSRQVDKDRSFKPEEYQSRISELKTEIAGLEALLKEPVPVESV